MKFLETRNQADKQDGSNHQKSMYILIIILITYIPYWPLFNRQLRTKTTFKFLSQGSVKKRPVKVGPVKLKAG